MPAAVYLRSAAVALPGSGFSNTIRKAMATLLTLSGLVVLSADSARAADVILDAAAGTRVGAFVVVDDSAAAGGKAAALPNKGRAKVVNRRHDPRGLSRADFHGRREYAVSPVGPHARGKQLVRERLHPRAVHQRRHRRHRDHVVTGGQPGGRERRRGLRVRLAGQRLWRRGSRARHRVLAERHAAAADSESRRWIRHRPDRAVVLHLPAQVAGRAEERLDDAPTAVVDDPHPGAGRRRPAGGIERRAFGRHARARLRCALRREYRPAAE